MDTESKSFALSLLDIASWSDSSSSGSYPQLKVAVPTLQRGLVWQPQQIELLWDSIFRGFPVGSFVLCPKIEGQERSNDCHITHHLLDGQQRCDAIRLGFCDVYTSEPAPVGQSMLWLDLNPALDQHSTRSFLFRLTNVGHPWGYAKNDASSSLQAWEVRAALSSVGLNPVDEGYQRPHPYQMSPYQAVCPTPLSWLLEAYRGSDSIEGCWGNLQQRLAFEFRPKWMAEGVAIPRWAEVAQAFLNDVSEPAMAQREFLFQGIKRAMDTVIFGLLAPDDIMHSSRLEADRAVEHVGVSNVEQLFQRLNRQGTRLDGEELAYSMIKAYWPELAEPIESMHVKRMPASRLVALAVRAAFTLAEKKSEALHSSLSVSQIRRIAAERGAEATAIQEFIANRLGPACEFIERVLGYEPNTNSKGLLPVHLAAVAKETPDLYLLLIIIADQLLKRDLKPTEFDRIQQALLSLTMHIRWFSERPVGAIQSIYRHLAQERIDANSLERSIQVAIRRGELIDLPSVAEVRSFVNFSPIPSLKDWNWSGQFELLRASSEEPSVIDRWEAFLRKLMNSRELLLYAQREYVAERFADYDPSQRDYWMGHHRPWDFDHLHAAKYVSNLKRKEKPYLDFSKQWVHTIGNLRAWPFEDNRSDHADPATVKFLANEATAGRKLKQSFLQYEEVEAFAGGYVMLHEQDLALKFATTVMRRMIRIYSECYGVVAMED